MTAAPEPLPPPAGFVEAAAAQQIELDPDDLTRLGVYLALLLETNRHFNLTAVRDANDAWHRLIFDSLTLLPYVASAAARVHRRSHTSVGCGGPRGLGGSRVAEGLRPS